MPRLIDSDRQAAVRDAIGGENVRRRVITVWDAEMIGELLDVPGALILQDVQAIKAQRNPRFTGGVKLSIAGSQGRSGPDSIY